jgi:hypothetical protein
LESPIAERTLDAVAADGTRFILTLRVGAAYQSSDVSWSCPIEAISIKQRLPDITGIDSWQATLLSFRLLSDIAGHFVEQGGQLFWPGSHDSCDPSKLWLSG